MSFQQPLLLLGLLLVPLAVAAYARHERLRRRRERAFAAPATAPSVAPVRPRCRRHAPPLLAGLALTGLLVAVARPQVSMAVPVEQARIVLAIDDSRSMQATDVAPSRLAAAMSAAGKFLDEVPREVRVGGVVFDRRAEAVRDPTTDRAALRQALRDAMRPSGGTVTGNALATSLAMLQTQAGPERRPPAAVVLLSDGATTHGRDPLAVADEARAMGVPVYTVALGTPQGISPRGEPVPPHVVSLRAIAQRSGGEAFTARDAGTLGAVYERLGSQAATERQQREVTAAFAGGAVLLLAGAVATSLIWFRRLI